jgi:molybdate transport system ATP-binding protein
MNLSIRATKRLGPFSLDADLAVSGARVGVFGPSGSGKSTVTRLLAGLLRPDRGEIHLDGKILFSDRHRIDLSPESRRVAMVTQNPALFPHLTVRGNLLFGWRRQAPTAERRVDPSTVADALGLTPLLDRPVRNLSGGETQRVALGRAVLASPRLLVMDEPLTGLEDARRFQVIPYLRRTCERFGIPYLFISHSLLELRLLTDVVARMDGGTVVSVLSSEELALDAVDKQAGYANLLRVDSPREVGEMTAWRFGRGEIFLLPERGEAIDFGEALFELSARNMVLVRNNPGTVSARNLFPARVERLLDFGRMVGVELSCFGQEHLVAEVVREAAAELSLEPGLSLFVAVKATAFRRVG